MTEEQARQEWADRAKEANDYYMDHQGESMSDEERAHHDTLIMKVQRAAERQDRLRDGDGVSK